MRGKKQIDSGKRKLKKRLIFFLLLMLSLVLLIQLKNAFIGSSCTIKKNLLIVNRSYSIDKGYVPDDLIEPSIPIAGEVIGEERQVDKKILEPLKELFNEASKNGYKLYLLSGYRSYNTQEDLYENKVKENGQKYADLYVSKPGHSEHQSGLALDITNESRNFVNSEESYWLANNAHKFGFIIRYLNGKEDITGYNYEPWHIRYVGKEVAEEIFKRGITLEEYLN